MADVGVPHHSARWLAEEAEPGGNGRSCGSVGLVYLLLRVWEVLEFWFVISVP